MNEALSLLTDFVSIESMGQGTIGVDIKPSSGKAKFGKKKTLWGNLKKQLSGLDPFSSAGQLNALSFIIVLLPLIAFSMSFMPALEGRLEASRANHNFRFVVIWYVMWVMGSLLVFHMVANLFIKRWSSILGGEIRSGWLKLLIRLMLLSPLLSIWFVGLTSLFTKRGFYFVDGVRIRRLIFSGVLSLGVFHVGYIAWQIDKDEMEFSSSGLRVKNLETPKLSMSFVEKYLNENSNEKEQKIGEIDLRHKAYKLLPNEGFYVHFYPYLDPAGKYFSALSSDILRSFILFLGAHGEDKSMCRKRLGYIGVEVKDCFFYNYRQAASGLGFASPLPGLALEVKYRTNLLAGSMTGDKPMSPEQLYSHLASGLIFINNALMFLEAGNLERKSSFPFQPEGLIRALSNPELPIMKLGRDLESFVMSRKVVPQLQAQLAAIENTFASVRFALNHDQQSQVSREITGLHGRLKVVAKSPLRFKPRVL